MGKVLLYIFDCVVFLFILLCIFTGNAEIEDYIFLVGTIVFPAYDLIQRLRIKSANKVIEATSDENPTPDA